jgi:hypothetical protein
MTAVTHRIRLKGPWDYEWVASDDAATIEPGSAVGRVKMPADWQSTFGNRSGTVRFHRRFHRPTNLEPYERVSIAFDGIGGAGEVWLNGRKLGAFGVEDKVLCFEVTPCLEMRNELIVEVCFDPSASGRQPGGLWGPVAIEIRGESAC